MIFPKDDDDDDDDVGCDYDEITGENFGRIFPNGREWKLSQLILNDEGCWSMMMMWSYLQCIDSLSMLNKYRDDL